MPRWFLTCSKESQAEDTSPHTVSADASRAEPHTHEPPRRLELARRPEPRRPEPMVDAGPMGISLSSEGGSKGQLAQDAERVGAEAVF